MKEKINFHTHTLFCDGDDTPEALVLTAIQKGFSVLGFSGHTLYPFADEWHIESRKHKNYILTIKNLAKKYENQIKILCGFEADFLPPFSTLQKSQFSSFSPDYLIGAVHYLASKNYVFTVDGSAENVKDGIKNFFNGNGKKCVCEYFEAQRQMLKNGNFQIWAHPDLIRKRNGILNFFNENESWYKKELKSTVKAAAKSGVVAEINTGALARGAMNDIYPSEFFLNLLFEAKVPVCVNSDCHNKSQLDCAFDRAYSIAEKVGYKELVYPTFYKNYIVKL